jgi:hypothetical protein
MHKSIRHFLIKAGLPAAISCGILLISSCQKEEKAPVTKDKMAAILVEVHLAEAYTSLLPHDSTGAPKNLDSLGFYYKRILSKYRLTPQSFDSAIQWYRFHPAQMDSLYAKVVAHFDSLQATK